MRVAVIIAARDVATFLPDAIRSALDQSHAETTVVVVDDGSVDDTVGVIAAHASPRLHSLRTPGLGLSAARNLGAGHAAALSPDALLFLDGDDWLALAALTTLTQALARAPAAIAAHAPFAFVTETAKPNAPGPLDRRAAPSRPSLLSRLVLGNLFANGGHVLIRTAAWRAAGPFREDLSFAEDWEFWTRLAPQGRFSAVDGPPALFVRRRSGSLMHGAATRMDAYQPALAAIAGNPEIARRLGRRRSKRLLQRAKQEILWTTGREMLRRGDAKGALPLLWQGMGGRFRPQRIALLARAWAEALR
jgi:glycosyltransferase involved in cell wall biosynthesis